MAPAPSRNSEHRQETDTVTAVKSRRLALGGVVGPAAFVSAWFTGGLVTDRDYAPFNDTISRLAGIGADTRPLMTSGMITFGIAVPAFAVALRRSVPGPAWISAAATGISTLFVAALAVDHSDLVDRLHFAAAGVGYVTLALTPFLAARPLMALGERRLAIAGLVLGSISSVALPVSLATEYTGFFQRLGLTATDIWLAATALWIWFGSASDSPNTA